MTVTWDSRVVEIHLPEQADELARTAISTFQRRHVPPSPTGLMDAGRVMVVGSCAALCEAEASLERLIEAPSVLRVLCMVVDDGDGALPPALRLPRLLDQSRSVGTLWIGDGRGVLWRMGTTKAQAITTVSQEGAEALPVGSVLAALREPEVFDATFSAATSSGHVFSPALHVFLPSTTPSVIKASERAAVRALAGDDSAPVAALLRPSDLEDEAFLLGNAPNPSELFDHRGPTGQLAGQVQACIDSAQASLQRVASVRGGSVASDAVAQVRAVGRALDALHAFQRDELFAKINGSDGLDPTEVGILKAAGLRSASVIATSIGSACATWPSGRWSGRDRCRRSAVSCGAWRRSRRRDPARTPSTHSIAAVPKSFAPICATTPSCRSDSARGQACSSSGSCSPRWRSCRCPSRPSRWGQS